MHVHLRMAATLKFIAKFTPEQFLAYLVSVGSNICSHGVILLHLEASDLGSPWPSFLLS